MFKRFILAIVAVCAFAACGAAPDATEATGSTEQAVTAPFKLKVAFTNVAMTALPPGYLTDNGSPYAFRSTPLGNFQFGWKDIATGQPVQAQLVGNGTFSDSALWPGGLGPYSDPGAWWGIYQFQNVADSRYRSSVKGRGKQFVVSVPPGQYTVYASFGNPLQLNVDSIQIGSYAETACYGPSDGSNIGMEPVSVLHYTATATVRISFPEPTNPGFCGGVYTDQINYMGLEQTAKQCKNANGLPIEKFDCPL